MENLRPNEQRAKNAILFISFLLFTRNIIHVIMLFIRNIFVSLQPEILITNK